MTRAKLGDYALWIGEMPDAKGANHGIEGAIRIGNALALASSKRMPGLRQRASRPSPARDPHPGSERAAVGSCAGEASGAGRNIEQAHTRIHIRASSSGAIAPSVTAAKGHYSSGRYNHAHPARNYGRHLCQFATLIIDAPAVVFWSPRSSSAASYRRCEQAVRLVARLTVQNDQISRPRGSLGGGSG